MPGAGSFSFAAWQDHMLVPREAAMDDNVLITARSIDEGARALIILSIWFFAGRPIALKMKEILQEQFPSPRPTVEGGQRTELALFALRVKMYVSLFASPAPRHETF